MEGNLSGLLDKTDPRVVNGPVESTRTNKNDGIAKRRRKYSLKIFQSRFFSSDCDYETRIRLDKN